MLDHTDKRIIDELSKNGRISMKELGQLVHLTGQAAANRVSRLEEEGFIEGYTIRFNQEKAGLAVHAFIHIYIRGLYHGPYLAFVQRQTAILHHYKTSGETCYMMECRFPSNAALDQFLTDLNEHANYRLSIVINQTL
ncbi:transcriptional regulator, AsnC family [Paenibacillus algorifonticola]|uniref:Transcriptional regulator, AsnC family n=1 Tax=Paenibacillus algorifonticola TaxID=684063 RepID=A0A1I2D7S1_9BACL|nr:Lrp/AsnC family transcriptional regulator [Paenibacillus algorifonticola]SFE76555.1 transcriptional regulator, AsnC family [Paenibacillus algorifonticola]